MFKSTGNRFKNTDNNMPGPGSQYNIINSYKK